MATQFITGNQATILKWYKKQAKQKRFLDDLPSLEGFGNATQTQFVSPRIVEEIEKKCGITPVLVKVIPVLYRNLCHNNTELMLTILNKNSEKYKGVFGYNITACDCGKLYTFEFHSLLKHIETGEYVDLTTDFGGETEKWFLPVSEDWTFKQGKIIRHFQMDFFYNSKKPHTCGCGRKGCWRPVEDFRDGDLNGFIKSARNLLRATIVEA